MAPHASLITFVVLCSDLFHTARRPKRGLTSLGLWAEGVFAGALGSLCRWRVPQNISSLLSPFLNCPLPLSLPSQYSLKYSESFQNIYSGNACFHGHGWMDGWMDGCGLRMNELMEKFMSKGYHTWTNKLFMNIKDSQRSSFITNNVTNLSIFFLFKVIKFKAPQI